MRGEVKVDIHLVYKDCAYKLDVKPLGGLIYKKTQGNPFFVNQLLATLHKNGHIRFTTKTGGQSSELARGGMLRQGIIHYL